MIQPFGWKRWFSPTPLPFLELGNLGELFSSHATRILKPLVRKTMKLKKTLKIMKRRKMMVKVEIDVMKNTHVTKATSDPSNIPWLHKKTMHYPKQHITGNRWTCYCIKGWLCCLAWECLKNLG